MKNIPYLLLLFFCSLAFPQQAAQKYNLSFDTYNSAEPLPTGWFKWGTYPLEVDSLEGGKDYVVKIASADTEPKFGSVAYHIPANYLGDSIRLTGRMKLEGVSESSSAGLLMRVDGNGKGGGSLAFDNMRRQMINGTRDWEEYSVTLPLSDKSAHIYVGGILSGTGTVWFDDLRVSIDGKDVQLLKEIVKPETVLNDKEKKSLTRLFRKNHSEIDLSSEEALDASLDALVERLGDNEIVAIGEDTHGSSEYYRLRAALSKRLISEKGFNTIVLENPYDDIEMMTRTWQDTPLDTLMRRHLFPIYQTQEMISFLEWLRGTGVRFTGCDDSFYVLQELLKEKIAAMEDAELSALLLQLRDAADLPVEEFNSKYPELAEKPSDHNDLGTLAYQLGLELEKALEQKGLLSEELREQLFQSKSTYVNYSHMKNRTPIVSRDEMMARRISAFAKDPDAKIIVWAHNAHISNATIIDNEIGKMGETLKQEFGDAYHSVGMSSLEGSYSFIESRFINGDHEYDDALHQADLKHQPVSSWELLLAAAGEASYFLDLQALKSQTDTPAKVDYLKLLGYSEESETDYYQLSPFQMFDSLFFIRNTTATEPLFP